jgi:hypothetical protein
MRRDHNLPASDVIELVAELAEERAQLLREHHRLQGQLSDESTMVGDRVPLEAEVEKLEAEILYHPLREVCSYLASCLSTTRARCMRWAMRLRAPDAELNLHRRLIELEERSADDVAVSAVDSGPFDYEIDVEVLKLDWGDSELADGLTRQIRAMERPQDIENLRRIAQREPEPDDASDNSSALYQKIDFFPTQQKKTILNRAGKTGGGIRRKGPRGSFQYHVGDVLKQVPAVTENQVFMAKLDKISPRRR